jgi:hypothetical protein
MHGPSGLALNDDGTVANLPAADQFTNLDADHIATAQLAIDRLCRSGSPLWFVRAKGVVAKTNVVATINRRPHGDESCAQMPSSDEQRLKISFRQCAAGPCEIDCKMTRKVVQMTRKRIFTVLGIAAAAALTPTVASAQAVFSVSIGSGSSYGYSGYGYDRYSNYDRHRDQHEQLAEEHADDHDQLREQHFRAHEQGLDSWEHAQLHRDLRYQHAQNDYQVAREHQRQHYYDDGGRYRRYGNYGSYGY